MEKTSSNEVVPEELLGTFEKLTESLNSVKSAITPLTNTSRNEVITGISPLDTAKIDLLSAYTCNSLFWAYLVTQGINPKSYPIKQELDRIQKYMGRLKEVEDRKLGRLPKLEVDTAKRIIRNATYDLDAKNTEMSQKRRIENKNDHSQQSNDMNKKQKFDNESKNKHKRKLKR